VELRSSKERCYEKFVACVQRIKTSFANIGTYSNEDNFVLGDPEGPIDWINGEAKAFEEVLSGHGDVCAFSGARGIAAILEKAGCEHVKILAQAEAAFSIEDTKDPSAEASLVGGKFFTDIWENGGRGMAHEIIKKSEKDTHDAIEAAKAARTYLCFVSQLNYLLPRSLSSHWPTPKQKRKMKLQRWPKLLWTKL
jgi:hypothetical protein